MRMVHLGSLLQFASPGVGPRLASFRAGERYGQLRARIGKEGVRDRPVIKQFGAQPLTREEQEEATRLSTIAAKMGTDPTAIIGRVQTFFRHDALEGGIAKTSS
jgi:hypothetical protein